MLGHQPSFSDIFPQCTLLDPPESRRLTVSDCFAPAHARGSLQTKSHRMSSHARDQRCWSLPVYLPLCSHLYPCDSWHVDFRILGAHSSSYQVAFVLGLFNTSWISWISLLTLVKNTLRRYWGGWDLLALSLTINSTNKIPQNFYSIFAKLMEVKFMGKIP